MVRRKSRRSGRGSRTEIAPFIPSERRGMHHQGGNVFGPHQFYVLNESMFSKEQRHLWHIGHDVVEIGVEDGAHGRGGRRRRRRRRPRRPSTGSGGSIVSHGQGVVAFVPGRGVGSSTDMGFVGSGGMVAIPSGVRRRRRRREKESQLRPFRSHDSRRWHDARLQLYIFQVGSIRSVVVVVAVVAAFASFSIQCWRMQKRLGVR
mmetsp:Transcript_13094/g.27524  ORF Transcript_13094/g.27524 Transcript_13094/m.27524 type:complete len:204 (+) Transcript_13094:2728-3339(+)